MDRKVTGEQQHAENLLGDFDALFAELDCVDSSAPFELGMRRMCGQMEQIGRVRSQAKRWPN